MENKVKLNLTIELESEEEVYRFEKWLEQYIKIVDLQILPDTKELYENDSNFRRLTEKYYEAKRARNDYINEKLF